MEDKSYETKKYFTELKVGIFFMVAIIIFFIALLSIRQVGFLKGSYILKVRFYFVEGLRPASPVRFCGADVGEVKKVKVINENGKFVVYVYANIDKDIRIPRNSTFIINSLSLFGEKYLEIISPEKIDSYIREGEIVEGISPIPLFTVLSNFHKTMNEVNEFVKEGKLKTVVEDILSNIEIFTERAKEILEDFSKGQSSIYKFIYEDSIYRSLQELIDEIKRNPWKLFYKPKETKAK